MGRLHRGAVALCAAFVLLATGTVTVGRPAANETTRPSSAPAGTRRDTTPTVVPGRYLVQVEPSAMARVRTAAERAGATVNESYHTLWSGLSVTATGPQLQRIQSAAGVASVFPVYRLYLDDDPVTDQPDAPSAEPTDAPSTEPTDHPSTEPNTTPTEPTDAPPSTETTDAPTRTGGPALAASDSPAPRAADDTADAPYLEPTTINVLGNDTSGSPELELDQTSVVLTGAGASPDGERLTVDGRGTFSVQADGTVSFTSAAGWTGTLDPVTYRVSDSVGTPSSDAKITVTVAAPDAPAAGDDAAQGTTGHPVTVPVLANDKAGGRAILQPDSLQVRDGEGWGASAETDDGTWTVAAGRIKFDPADGFTGPARVDYRVSDELGQAASATLTVTLHGAPTAPDHEVGTPYLTAVTERLLPEGLTGIRLLDSDGNPVDQLELPGQGTYTVDESATGLVFRPADGFAGLAAPARFEYTDADGGTIAAWLFVTVDPPQPPTADDVTLATTSGDSVRSGTLADGTAQLCVVVPVGCVNQALSDSGVWTVEDGRVGFSAAGDFQGTAEIGYRLTDRFGRMASARLVVTVHARPTAHDHTTHTPYRTAVTERLLPDDGPWTLRLLDASGNPVPELDVPEQGAYALTADGTGVTFTPVEGFTGRSEAGYQVSNPAGATAAGRLSVDVGRPPAAAADEATTRQNVTLTGPTAIDPLANDAPGDDGAGHPGDLDHTSVAFVDDKGADLGRSLDTDAGTWTIDPATGKVDFDPAPGFTDVAVVHYRVTDSFHNPATGTISVAIEAVTPVAHDDSGHGPARHRVENIPVLANDVAGDDSAPLQPDTLALVGDGTDADGATRTVDGVGVWTVNADHTVTFEPDRDFHGDTASTRYRVTDTNGTAAEATISVAIGALTKALPYLGSTKQNVTVSVPPSGLATLGDDGEGNPGTVASLVFRIDPPDAGRQLFDDDRTLWVQGEGTWRVDAATQVVTFYPEMAYRGTAEAAISLTDSFGNTVTGTIGIQVAAITPILKEDVAHTAANRAVTIDVLGNDEAGDASAPLSPRTVELVAPETDKGAWQVNSDGTVTFSPARDFTGRAESLYRVQDANHTVGTEVSVQVAVGALPTAADKAVTVSQDGSTVTLDPVAGSTPGDDGAGDVAGGFVRSAVRLTSSGVSADGKALTTASYAWNVGSDGTVRFTPDWRFTGTATATYRATDSFGNTADAAVTVVVTPSAPTATEKRLASIGALQTDQDGSGVRVGIIDSGISYDHPDLGGASRILTGYDYVDGDNTPADCFGHGTKVAGILGANGNPKLGGAYGVAPKVSFGAYRVFDCQGSATSDKIVKAMERAATDRMNVVNLSLGATSASWPDDPLSKAAANLVKRGVVVVAASGNSGDKGLFTVGSPAVAPGVIALAAADSGSSRVEAYSAMGLAADLSLSPTLTAPGSKVHTTAMGRAYADPTGTSMASPEVAGAVARILQANAWTTPTAGVPAKVAALLYASASTLDSGVSSVAGRPDGVFRQGAGLLQLEAALRTPVTASPATLNLGEGTTHTRTVTLTNTGTRSITYKVTATTGASAAASTGSRMDVGNQTPYWAYAPVGFTASPSSVAVPAGRTAKVTVKITAPGRILSGKQGMLYGGWVRFSATGQQTVSVPFAGLRGDYQKVKLLPSGTRGYGCAGTRCTLPRLPALAYRDSSGTLRSLTSTRTFRPLKGDRPVVMFHLDYPASAIRLKAINQRTKKSYYAVLSGTLTQFGKQGRDEFYSAITFYGAYNSRGRAVAVPAGTYKLQLRVLKPLGNARTSSHWETYTTRSFRLTWS